MDTFLHIRDYIMYGVYPSSEEYVDRMVNLVMYSFKVIFNEDISHAPVDILNTFIGVVLHSAEDSYSIHGGYSERDIIKMIKEYYSVDDISDILSFTRI